MSIWPPKKPQHEPAKSLSSILLLGRGGGGKSSVKPLIRYLSSDYEIVRKAATEALGLVGQPAVGSLIKALKGRDTHTRVHAAWALGLIGGTQAVESLMQALGDELWKVRQSAAGALAEIAIAQPGLSDLNRAVDPLIQTLKDENKEVREAGVWALMSLAEAQIDPSEIKRSVQPLIQALNDVFWKVKVRAAYALEKIDDPRAITPLIQALKDEKEQVRRDVVKALGTIGDLSVLQELERVAAKDTDDVAKLAEEAVKRTKERLE